MRSAPASTFHCVRWLDPEDVTALNGIPSTTVARTLVDLCAVVPDRLVERALDQAHVLRLRAPDAIEDALELAGYRVTRFTYRQVAFAPDDTLRRTRLLLAGQ